MLMSQPQTKNRAFTSEAAPTHPPPISYPDLQRLETYGHQEWFRITMVTNVSSVLKFDLWLIYFKTLQLTKQNNTAVTFRSLLSFLLRIFFFQSPGSYCVLVSTESFRWWQYISRAAPRHSASTSCLLRALSAVHTRGSQKAKLRT
jgi:hypothetical protein